MKFLSVCLIAVVFSVGCGGGSSPAVGGGVGGINVNVTSPAGAAAVDSGLVLPITVTVTNDSSNAGVIWSVGVLHKGDPAGTLTDIKADAVTYTPADNLAAPIQVTVTATSVTDPTRAAAIPITVYPAVAITTKSSNLSTAFVNTDYSCIQPFKLSGTVVQISCEVDAIGGLGPYTWSVDNSILPDGLLIAPGLSRPPATSTELILGKPGTVGIFPFNVTVKDSLGGTTTAALSINVAPGQLKIVTPTIVSTTPNVPYSPVALQVSGGVPPYTWSLVPGLDPAVDLPQGMQLSPNGVISGTPITAQLAQFALRVRDSQSPVPAEAIFPAPKAAGQDIGNNIILASSGLEPPCDASGSKLLAGAHYAFLLTGFDSTGPVTYSGSLVADLNGNLTGVEDIILSGSAQLNQPLAAGSAIQFNNVGRGCLTLTSASASAVFRAWVAAIDSVTASVTEARVLEFDDTDGAGTRLSGFLRIQDDTAFSNAPSGPYAFRFSGWNSAGHHFAMAGTATADSGLLSSVSADVNDGGVASGALNGGTGTISSLDASGRGTATLSIGTATYDLIAYVVDADNVIFNSTQAASAGHPLITGEATASAGPFSAATLSNSDIYRFGGALVGTPDVGVGVLHFDGSAAVSGTAFERSGNRASATAVAGQYGVDPTTGRFTFTANPLALVGYAVCPMASSGCTVNPPTAGCTVSTASDGLRGFLVGTGASAISGVMEFQTDKYPPGCQFGPISLIYSVGTDAMLDRQSSVFAGRESLASDGSVTRFDQGSALDVSRPTGLIPTQQFSNFRYTWSPDGSGTFGANTYMVTNGPKFFYIDISPFEGHPSVVVGQRHQ